MQLRRIIARHRAGFALLLFATVLLRVLVPSGFMPMPTGNGGVVLAFCPSAGEPMPMQDGAGMTMAMHHGDAHGHEDGSGTGHDVPCAYAGLALSVLGSADPALLLAALAFAFVLALLLAERVLPPRPQRLRPPLRAPPPTA